LKTIADQVLYLLLRFRKKAFARLEPYMAQILNKDYAGNANEIRRVFNNTKYYFNFLRQFFGDLDETKTAEL
jgi:hypothetical protein